MATYPTSIVSFREKENLPGLEFDAENKKTLFVEDLTKIEDEIIAVEETLGEEVLGASETVADRLTDIEAALTYLQTAAWPIGSVYINADDYRNPSYILGFGEWEAWGVGKAIVGIDATQTEFDTAGETGGTKTVTLTETQIPSHAHGGQGAFGYNLIKDWGGASVRRANMDEAGSGFFILGSSDTNDISWSSSTGAAGGGGAHNNLQPYQVGYVWKRVA